MQFYAIIKKKKKKKMTKYINNQGSSMLGHVPTAGMRRSKHWHKMEIGEYYMIVIIFSCLL